MLLGTGLMLLAMGVGLKLGRLTALAPVRGITWWLHRVILPLLQSLSWWKRAGAIWVNNVLILTGLAINTYLLGERLPTARPRRAATNPLFSTYKCSDDRWIALGGLQSDRYWPALCEAMGMEHLKDDPKFCDMKARIQSHEELVDIMDG
ncbi:MAG: CoA transferase, partial [Proteobacteria bacterium]|nr:CoA transferase [Pseudomonadota bacterium]